MQCHLRLLGSVPPLFLCRKQQYHQDTRHNPTKGRNSLHPPQEHHHSYREYLCCCQQSHPYASYHVDACGSQPLNETESLVLLNLLGCICEPPSTHQSCPMWTSPLLCLFRQGSHKRV